MTFAVLRNLAQCTQLAGLKMKFSRYILLLCTSDFSSSGTVDLWHFETCTYVLKYFSTCLTSSSSMATRSEHPANENTCSGNQTTNEQPNTSNTNNNNSSEKPIASVSIKPLNAELCNSLNISKT